MFVVLYRWWIFMCLLYLHRCGGQIWGLRTTPFVCSQFPLDLSGTAWLMWILVFESLHDFNLFYWGGNPTSRGQTSQARPFPFSSTDPKDLACKTKGKHALDKLYSKPLSLDLKFSCISHSQPMVGYQYSTSLPAYCTQLHFTQTPPPLWKWLTY